MVCFTRRLLLPATHHHALARSLAEAARSFQWNVRMRRHGPQTATRHASTSKRRQQELATYGGTEGDGFVPFEVGTISENTLVSQSTNQFQESRLETISAEDDLEPAIKIRDDLRDSDVPTSQKGLAKAISQAKSTVKLPSSSTTTAPTKAVASKKGRRQTENTKLTTSKATLSSSKQPNPQPQLKAGSPAKPISHRHLEPWQIQKYALREKFPTGWAPPKKLSPDAQDGIRALHTHDPATFSTTRLSKQFEVSPEAIRRILRSKWRPNAEEEEKRRERWERRGERIWSGLVEQGVHAPKAWRSRGIGTGPRRVGQDRGTRRRTFDGRRSQVGKTADDGNTGEKTWLGGLTERIG